MTMPDDTLLRHQAEQLDEALREVDRLRVENEQLRAWLQDIADELEALLRRAALRLVRPNKA
jgi:hypothetical protein